MVLHVYILKLLTAISMLFPIHYNAFVHTLMAECVGGICVLTFPAVCDGTAQCGFQCIHDNSMNAVHVLHT